MRPYQSLPLIVLLGLVAGQSRPAADVADLIKQLSGQSAAPPRTPEQFAADYARALDALLPGMGAEALPDREAPQQSFEKICFYAGRPGADVERRTLCEAVAGRLGSQTAKPARVWLLRQLERLSGPESVAALAPLLADEDGEIRDLARRALQNNPSLAAAAALRDALEKAKDPPWQVALINALAARGDDASAPQLAAFIQAKDPAVVRAAVAALGDIGGPTALTTLPRCWSDAPAEVRVPVAEALLRAADRLLQRGDIEGAATIYTDVFMSAEVPPVRIAALHGLVAAHGEETVPMLIGIMADDTGDRALRAAAADHLAALPSEPLTDILANTFPDVSSATQILILRVLAQPAPAGGGPLRVAVAEAALLCKDAPVRLAALQALQELGDERSALLLVQTAAATEGAERDAARRALARLHAGGTDKLLLMSLAKAEPKLRVELIRALAARRCTDALPVLLAQAHHEDEPVRLAACEALGQLGRGDDAPALVKLLLTAEPDSVRDAAENAVVAVCQRITDAQQRAPAALAAWDEATPSVRVALLHVLGRVGGTAALAKIRDARHADDADIVDAAVRALARWPGAEALDDLLDIAQHSENKTHRVLALQGYIRLLDVPSDRPAAATAQLYQTAMSLAQRPEEKKQVLGGVAKVRDLSVLPFLEQYLDDDALRAEAESGVITAAGRLAPWHREEANAALRSLADKTQNDKTRDDARKTLDQIRDANGKIATWQSAGPYFEAGQDWTYVQDHAFPPEVPGAAGVEWKPLPITNDGAPWVFDLTKTDDGQDRCLYLRAAVWSAEARDARLELGSDDGAKVWLNGRLVYEFNGRRAHETLRDKTPIKLDAGWNTLLVKVVEADGPWAVSCAVRDPDGKPLEDLKVQAEPPPKP